MDHTSSPAVVSEAADVLRWSVSHVESDVVVCLEGDLDLATVEPLGRLLREILESRPDTVVLDLARLSFLDSTGIHCLVNATRDAAGVGCKLVARHPTATVLRVLGICGVDGLLLDEADRGTTARR